MLSKTMLKLLAGFPNILITSYIVLDDVYSVHCFTFDGKNGAPGQSCIGTPLRTAILEIAASADSATGACSAEGMLCAQVKPYTLRRFMSGFHIL